jgi:ADP-ribosyl-[dinitrogen reductase] hydrolase
MVTILRTLQHQGRVVSGRFGSSGAATNTHRCWLSSYGPGDCPASLRRTLHISANAKLQLTRYFRNDQQLFISDSLTENQSSRILGSYYGSLVGDALGAPYEFEERDSYTVSPDYVECTTFHLPLPPGGWTDDSSMMLCLLESFLECGGTWNAADCVRRWIRWQDQGYMSVIDECFDIGKHILLNCQLLHDCDLTMRSHIGLATSRSLRFYQKHWDQHKKLPDELVFNTEDTIASNGSLMRLCPVPLLFIKSSPLQTAEMVKAASLPTHASTLCIGACALFSLYIHHFVHSALPTARERKRAVLSAGFDLLGAAEKPNYLLHPKIEAIRRGANWRGVPREQIRTSGYVIHTMEAALWALDTFDTFEEGIMTLLKMGEDVDTVRT